MNRILVRKLVEISNTKDQKVDKGIILKQAFGK
jgi:hypothetical protein